MKPGIFDGKHSYRLAFFLAVVFALLLNLSFPDSRLYWPYMLSAYWLGIFIYLGEMRRSPASKHPSLLDYLFPADTWLNRSSFHDCIIGLLNFILLGWAARIAAFSPETFQSWGQSILAYLPAHHAQTSEPTTGAIVFFVAMAMVIAELFFYISHRWQHTVPALWEFHKIHHSAEVMTPLTLYRMHPVVLLLPPLCRYIGLGLALCVFAYFYPDTKTIDIVSGTVLGVAVLNAIGGNLQHSHLWLRFPRPLEYLFVSPAMHQIHHSTAAKHLNKNYGTLFSFWDWMFGSIYVPKKKEDIVFGLGHPRQAKPYQSLWGLYVHPFRQIAKRIGWSRLIKRLA